VEDWPDWFQLAPAFVATYGAEELNGLVDGAQILRVVEEDEDVSRTGADRVYLKAPESWLDM